MGRASRFAELHMKPKRALHTRLGIEDWVTTQKRREWRWAEVVAREVHKQSYKPIVWNPGNQDKHDPHRRPQRPKTRWLDDITKYTQSISSHASWLELASTDQWHNLEHVYAGITDD